MNSVFLCCFILWTSCAAFEKPYYVVEGSNKDDSSMMYVFHTVLSLLDDYDRHEINGFEVSYNNDGLYFDPQQGPNLWHYYFEPTKLMHNKPHEATRLTNNIKSIRAIKAMAEMTRERKHFLIKKYIRIHQSVKDKLATFVQNNFQDNFVICVDYFSTSISFYNPTVSFDTIAQTAKKIINQLPLSTKFKIYLSTNNDTFLSYMQQEFGQAVCFCALVKARPSNFIDGQMWLLDCLLVAQSNILIESGSSLSKTAQVFNPSLEVIKLDTHWTEKE